MSKGRLTRQELSWLLTQEAQNAALLSAYDQNVTAQTGLSADAYEASLAQDRQREADDEASRPVATIDSLGALTETAYDKAGNAVKQIRYATVLTTQLASLLDGSGNPESG